MRAHPSRLSSLLLRAFTGVFCLLFLAITAAVLFATERHPEEYTYSLQPARMLLFVLFWAALFAGVFCICRRFGDLLCRHERWIAAAMVAVLAAGSLLAGWLLQVDTLNDVRAVFLTAQGLAREGAIPADFLGYFYIRPNNVASAVFLSLWLRVTALFGCADPGFSALLLNALLIALSGALLRLLVREIAGPVAGLQALFALLTCIPLYAYAAIYYSDLYAMPFVAGALLLYCRTRRTEGRRHLLLLLSCGLLLGIGIWIKVSVGVVAIAMLIHTLFQGKLRALLRFLALAGLPILLFLLAGNLLSAQLLPDAEQRQNAPLPYNHWIMMGLEGDGRWNNADEVFSASFGDPSLAAAADWEVIRQRVSAYGPLGMVQLWARKTMYSFGDGTYNVASMLDDNPLRPNFLHGILLYGSPHYLLFFYLCTSLYCLILAGAALRAGRDLLTGRSAADPVFLLRLCLFGFWLFMMLWESNARYLVHYLPVLYSCAFLGGDKAQAHPASLQAEKDAS